MPAGFRPQSLPEVTPMTVEFELESGLDLDSSLLSLWVALFSRGGAPGACPAGPIRYVVSLNNIHRNKAPGSNRMDVMKVNTPLLMGLKH